MRDFRLSKRHWRRGFAEDFGLGTFRKFGSVGYGSTVTSCSVGARPLHQSTSHLCTAASGVLRLTACDIIKYGLSQIWECLLSMKFRLPSNLSVEWRSNTAECCEFQKNLALLSQTMTCSLAAARTAQRVTYWSMAAVAQATRKCVCIRVTWRKNAAWLLQRNGGDMKYKREIRSLWQGKRNVLGWQVREILFRRCTRRITLLTCSVHKEVEWRLSKVITDFVDIGIQALRWWGQIKRVALTSPSLVLTTLSVAQPHLRTVEW
jgi:hypothetical protein